MNIKSYLFLLTTFNIVTASELCNEFLQKNPPQVVKNCGISDIVSYCCNDKNMEVLKSYADDFSILCEDTPEQQQAISNITSNIEKLSTECSKEPTLPDDWIKEKNNGFICKFNYINSIFTPLIFLLLI